MEAKYLQDFIKIMPLLKEVMQMDMTITVYDFIENKVCAKEVGGIELKSDMKIGDSFDIEKYPGLLAVKKGRKQITARTQKEKGNAKFVFSPVVDEEKGTVVACVAVRTSMEMERKIEDISSILYNSIEQLSSGIEGIASNSQQLAIFIKEIANFSIQTQSKITTINSTTNDIKNISTHSNLLALNASIESARAGDAGRGFSVVAEEMSKLSNSSKISADKITKSLLEIKDAIETINQQIGKISLTSENQAAATEQIAATSDEIVGLARDLADMVKIDTIDKALKGKE